MSTQFKMSVEQAKAVLAKSGSTITEVVIRSIKPARKISETACAIPCVITAQDGVELPPEGQPYDGVRFCDLMVQTRTAEQTNKALPVRSEFQVVGAMISRNAKTKEGAPIMQTADPEKPLVNHNLYPVAKDAVRLITKGVAVDAFEFIPA